MRKTTASASAPLWMAALLSLFSLAFVILWMNGVRPLFFPNILPALTEALFYLGTFALAWQVGSHFSRQSIVENLSGLSVAGIVTLAMAFIPEFLISRGLNDLLLLSIFYGLYLAVFALFLTLSFSLSIRLIRDHSSSAASLTRILIALFIATPLLQLVLPRSELLQWLLFITAGAIALPLFFKVDWIVTLSKKTRKAVLFYLIALGMMGGALLLKMLYPEVHISLPIRFGESWFLQLGAAYLIGFSITSALFLLFHLPVSSLLDLREKEKAHLFQSSLDAEKTLDAEAILTSLAENARQASNADSVWLAKVAIDSPDNDFLYAQGIALRDMKRIDYSLHAHSAHFRIDRVNSFLYIRNLSIDPILRDHILPIQSLAIYPFHLEDGSEWRLYLGFENPGSLAEHLAERVSEFVSLTRMSANHVMALRQAEEKARLEEEIVIGRNMQRRLLPRQFPFGNKIDIAAASQSAEEIGGDYYDCHVMSDHSIAVLMADVSGKGTSAALHVAEMKGIFQSLMLDEPEPVEFMSKANRAVSKCFDKGMFITVLYAIVDMARQELRYVRGGHCPMLHYDAQNHKIHTLQDEGLGLGIVADESFDQTLECKKLELNPGDIIVLYTDGIVESRAPDGFEEFGYERLRDCIYLNMELSSTDLNKKIIREVQQFTGNGPIRDDMSLMTLKIKGNGPHRS